MREIMFRAWDEDGGIMHRSTDLDVSEDYFTAFDSGVLHLYHVDSIGNYTNLKIMQYTGLKDKNGVEIYEGDIVRFGWQGNEVGIVKFEHGGYYVKTKTSRSYFMHPDAYEVVGNMYSDPELLEGIE